MRLTEELLTDVVTLAEKAGKTIMEIYSRSDFGVEYKDDASPLTIADKESNNIILSGLHDIDPRMNVLSEESAAVAYDDRKSWELFWLVDPLDGTKEFIKKNGEFTVNIALIDRRKSVLGVVHAPAAGATYYAANGLGARKLAGGQSRRISAAKYAGSPLKIIASRSHIGGKLENFIKKIGNAERISMGSSLKLCLVADGSAHLYPRLYPTMEWDTAAAQCVVEAAGGSVTDLDGEPLRYNKQSLLNPHFMVSCDKTVIWKKYLDDGS
ncbi:MAG: 3'(2'),5'-bisphosphate nucleotidase CysQ [bacterium]|nr:MAG: 3'(2'),5'-bisphosphate nucleotidase CysQ [bacterium]